MPGYRKKEWKYPVKGTEVLPRKINLQKFLENFAVGSLASDFRSQPKGLELAEIIQYVLEHSLRAMTTSSKMQKFFRNKNDVNTRLSLFLTKIDGLDDIQRIVFRIIYQFLEKFWFSFPKRSKTSLYCQEISGENTIPQSDPSKGKKITL